MKGFQTLWNALDKDDLFLQRKLPTLQPRNTTMQVSGEPLVF